MSLYNIVQHVNESLRDYDYDSQLAFTTNSACISVAEEMSEVLVNYQETPPDRVMTEHLKEELLRRIDIYYEMIEALENYEY